MEAFPGSTGPWTRASLQYGPFLQRQKGHQFWGKIRGQTSANMLLCYCVILTEVGRPGRPPGIFWKAGSLL